MNLRTNAWNFRDVPLSLVRRLEEKRETKAGDIQTGYRYQLEPHAHQLRRLNDLAGACRWVWNHFLRFREDAYLAAKAAGGALPLGVFSYVANARELTCLRKLIP